LSVRLRLELAPSLRLAAAIVALHACAAGSVAAVLPAWPGWLLAAALLALGGAAAWSRALLGSPGSVRAIEIVGPGRAALELAGGARLEAQVAARRYAGRWLVTLPVVAPSRRTLLITGDMLDRERFRLLRIWALWDRLPGVAAGQLPA
jgi:hypothetical protein